MFLTRAVALAVAFLILSCGSRQLSCTLTIIGYDTAGNMKEIPRILDVRQVLGGDDERSVPWLTDGRAVYLPARLHGFMIGVRFSGEGSRTFQMYKCHQKYSTVFAGRAGSPPVSHVSGRVTGCRLNREWWIRLYPMFGADPLPNSDPLESAIDPISGDFEVVGHFANMRHTVTLGRGKDPVHSFGIDVDGSIGEINAGRIDLAGKCPFDASDSGAPPPPKTPGCAVTINGYGARGDRVDPPSIKEVRAVKDNVEYLVSGLTAKGPTVSFPRTLLGKEIRVRFAESADQSIALRRCHQTVSIVFERRSGNLDVSGSTVSGTLTGCTLANDWWIRFYPMFGRPAKYRDGAFDGDIDPKTGRFEAIASFEGFRHTVTVGRGKDPLRSFGFDLRADADNELGDIDLAGRCRGSRTMGK